MQTGGFNQYYGGLLEEIRSVVGEQTDLEPEDVPPFSKDLSGTITDRLRRITIRTLILEMKVCDECSMLGDGDEYERYEMFAEHYLTDQDYLQELYDDYRPLYDCLKQYIHNTAQGMAPLLQRFETDRDELNQHFFPDNPCEGIKLIDGGSSDIHRGGQSVYILHLDNGKKIVYKPRDLSLDTAYIQFVQQLFQEIKMPYWWSQVWNRGKYGWCEWAEAASCQTREEIERYYARIGVLLCAGYLLGTSDIHYENLIACGEFPVIIDLEMAIGSNRRRKSDKKLSAAERVYQDSVLHTGLLPLYTFNENGEGINVGAINGQGGQLVPVEVPVIVRAGTVNMHVEYRKPQMKEGKNLVRLDGRVVTPYDYLRQIQDGFDRAYQYILTKQAKVTEWLEIFRGTKVRWLVRNTQLYAMFLMSAYHPGVLMNDHARDEFFQNWMLPKQLGSAEEAEEIRTAEIDALRCGDIPYFTYSGDECLQLIRERMRRMSHADLRQQKRLMEAALFIGTKDIAQGSGCICGDRLEAAVTEDMRLRLAEQVGDVLLENAVWSDDKFDVGWINIVLAGFGERGYLIRPAGDYLYDGTAGQALFVSKLAARSDRSEFKNLMDCLKKKLFFHTDTFAEKPKNTERLTGAYSGEASVAYAYQKLYEESKDEAYLLYMDKQCSALVDRLMLDKCYDLLGGNAGAILVFLNGYDLSGKNAYIEWAEKAADFLIDKANDFEWGWGWASVQAGTALTGLAHGSSGMMLAFGRLWKYTQKSKYLQAAREAYRFEQHYFHQEWDDWEDLRYPVNSEQQHKKHIAWCHGKGGIELARSAVQRYGVTFEDAAAPKVWVKSGTGIGGSEFCLCHGKLGAAAILYGNGEKEKAGRLWKQAVLELGVATVVYLAAIAGVDQELYEAAAIDGAGRWRQIWHVTLAGIRTTILTLFILRIGDIMIAGFDQIYTMSNDAVVSVADIIDTYVYRVGLTQRKFSLATAAGLFQSAIGLIMVLITNHLAKKVDPESGIV